MKIAELFSDMDYPVQTYSGRGMYGKSCLGVVLDDGQTLSGFFADVLRYVADNSTDLEKDLASLADVFDAARLDTLGRGGIVYFPTVAA